LFDFSGNAGATENQGRGLEWGGEWPKEPEDQEQEEEALTTVLLTP